MSSLSSTCPTYSGDGLLKKGSTSNIQTSLLKEVSLLMSITNALTDPHHYSSLNMRRLRNEADCLEFTARETTIPVPRVLAAYEINGSFILETERIDGVLMQDLKPEEQLEVIPQIRHYLEVLRGLRSNKLCRPSGIIYPPQAIFLLPNDCKSWSQTNISTSEFVFCHRDVSQANVFVHPITLQLLAIVDWEYGGLYPVSHELLFFESTKWLGIQVKTISGIKEIKEFWEKAADIDEEPANPEYS